MDQVNKSALKKICSVHLHVSVFRGNKNSKLYASSKPSPLEACFEVFGRFLEGLEGFVLGCEACARLEARGLRMQKLGDFWSAGEAT